MGISGLALWKSATPAAINQIVENIRSNQYVGGPMGRWYVHARTYRSPPYPKRAVYALSMNDATFVVAEDTEAPMPTALTEGGKDAEGGGGVERAEEGLPPHQRYTTVTLNANQPLDLLLAQMRWMPGRAQPTEVAVGAAGTTPAQVTSTLPVYIEGGMFSIEKDWVCKMGSLVTTGGMPRGVILEADYLPALAQSEQSPRLIEEFFYRIMPPAFREALQISTLTPAESEWLIHAHNVGVDDGDDIYCSPEDTLGGEKPEPDSSALHANKRNFLLFRTLQRENWL
ncbi:hypothetical protein BOTBODRAFT_26756 [Botryobasidium botryosum FD-172 SS1]|uniref:Mediator complex subunit 20 n=1 Tax=Botryobasidium botryosum (strain FD-172 SS1) TaxID=930990 RepID=A0A067N1B9_BOTB1|nr:hypothetical protein BOTBODRAFT_26756 [Botryobasidium botryosum FD-172 SS1]